MMLSIFSCACWPSVIFFGEMSIQVFCPFFNWVVGFFAVKLNNLEIKPLSVASFEIIFSNSVSYLFGFFLVSFAVQKLVSLIRSNWFIFALISVALGDWPEKIFIRLMSENVLPMFSSRSLMVSYLIFKSLAILSLFLCMVWGYIRDSLIYMSSFPSTT